MLTQHSGEKVDRMDVLPAIDDAMGLLCLGRDGIAEVDGELSDISEGVLVGSLLVEAVELGQ